MIISMLYIQVKFCERDPRDTGNKELVRNIRHRGKGSGLIAVPNQILLILPEKSRQVFLIWCPKGRKGFCFWMKNRVIWVYHIYPKCPNSSSAIRNS